MEPYREISNIQSEYLDSYLDKSKDTLEEFLSETGDKEERVEFEGLGWIEYSRHDDILWIHSAYSCRPHKETKRIWANLKKIAKNKGCKKIQFTTRRHPKAFEKLFNAKTIQYKLEVTL
tara:strand:- start:565 stop:921 length:357 start_codon:yes stop_codon:yes gene_type:complete